MQNLDQQWVNIENSTLYIWKLECCNKPVSASAIHNLVGASADEFQQEVSDVLQDELIEPTIIIQILGMLNK